ncbi:unnamed protein product [Polarella glacialis]|uniref:Uncharacterized protein n=1 Tax=Polarella glacialis TaxID=89957 RepID=A0A813D3S0_POLGL|nr:unnamed protein product [Polarella glacialis]
MLKPYYAHVRGVSLAALDDEAVERQSLLKRYFEDIDDEDIGDTDVPSNAWQSCVMIGSPPSYASEIILPIKELRYSQCSISDHFRNGRSIYEVAAEVTSDPELLAHFPRLNVVRYSGKNYSMDNRRLWLLKECFKHKDIGVHLFSDVDAYNAFVGFDPRRVFGRKYSTGNDGTHLRITAHPVFSKLTGSSKHATETSSLAPQEMKLESDSASNFADTCWDVAPTAELDSSSCWGGEPKPSLLEPATKDGADSAEGQVHAADSAWGDAPVAESEGLVWDAAPIVENGRGDASSDLLEAGIAALFEEIKLSSKALLALKWAQDTGAVRIEELLENADGLSAALNLKPLERKRLLRARDSSQCARR